jgi:hypothetical protein
MNSSKIFTEQDKVTPPKPVVINGTHELQVSYPGSGAVKGVNFSDNGALFLVPRSDGFADLSGHAVITTVEVLHFSIQPQGANLALLIIWW